MRAALQRRPGGPEGLVIRDVLVPQPGPDEVGIRIHAAAFNRLDVLQLGTPILPGFRLPHIAGLNFAGEIIATDSGINGYRVGTRVIVNPQFTSRAGGEKPVILGGNAAGGFAEQCSVPAVNAQALPDALPLPRSRCLSHRLCHRLARAVRRRSAKARAVAAGSGAGSALTLAARQFADGSGAQVIVSGRDRGKLARAERLGAAITASSRTDDIADIARTETNGQGIDLVFDHAGATTIATSLQSLRPEGTLVVAGHTSGDQARVTSLAALFHIGITIKGAGPTFTCVPVIDTIGRLHKLPAFCQRLFDGHSGGKLLNTPSQALHRHLECLHLRGTAPTHLPLLCPSTISSAHPSKE
ncbi:zinc-binding dehydrogenase [Streptomyces collinus]|uniref:zinc-binding dehydrogenase n=1 Tax=Streptomyces collinus TaxID=42684 RepID=UPI0036992752